MSDKAKAAQAALDKFGEALRRLSPEALREINRLTEEAKKRDRPSQD